jgi:hypothetical protein
VRWAIVSFLATTDTDAPVEYRIVTGPNWPQQPAGSVLESYDH